MPLFIMTPNDCCVVECENREKIWEHIKDHIDYMIENWKCNGSYVKEICSENDIPESWEGCEPFNCKTGSDVVERFKELDQLTPDKLIKRANQLEVLFYNNIAHNAEVMAKRARNSRPVGAGPNETFSSFQQDKAAALLDSAEKVCIDSEDELSKLDIKQSIDILNNLSNFSVES